MAEVAESLYPRHKQVFGIEHMEPHSQRGAEPELKKQTNKDVLETRKSNIKIMLFSLLCCKFSYPHTFSVRFNIKSFSGANDRNKTHMD